MRHFFRTNDTPIYFIGATPFNLLGLDRWIRNFSYITYYDGWDGAHPRVFTPRSKPYIEFSSGEEINNWLLENAEVRAFIDRRKAAGLRPKIAMVFFDEETERICEELGYDLILPSAQLRNHMDSKLVTTRLANEVGVASVPNVLTSVHDWPELAEAADRAGLGSDWRTRGRRHPRAGPAGIRLRARACPVRVLRRAHPAPAGHALGYRVLGGLPRPDRRGPAAGAGDRLGAAPRPGRAGHHVRLPADTAQEGPARRPVRVPQLRERRARLGMRGRGRHPDAGTHVQPAVEPPGR
jgi:hypothetical protein